MSSPRFKKPWPMWPKPDRIVLLKRACWDRIRALRTELKKLQAKLDALEEKI